ncbi:DUF7336 domain-containing protein [Schlesneria paludicola]|uniref:DUF7336 domain-containing protein n=1 Tax=Schlesneria paludicola TaxID=360056 RepID=UPI0002F32C89|nr:hypothetical protein [Schlesneria paludicola]
MEIPSSVFLVQHLHIHDGGEECVKMVGVYESRRAAQEAVGRVASQLGFRDMPKIIEENSPTYLDESGFYISEYEIGKDHWTEGFVTEKF